MKYHKLMKRLAIISVIILFSINIVSASSVEKSNLLTRFLASTEAVFDQLKEQIKALESQIAELMNELKATKSELSTTKAELEQVKVELKFTKILRRGATGDEVVALQEFLKQNPDIYPEGLVTGYFGSLTEKAVQRWQEKQGIVNSGNPNTTGYGQVGPKTIEKLNETVSSGGGGATSATPATPATPSPEAGIPAIPATPATPATSDTSITPHETTSATSAEPATPAVPSSGGGGGGGGGGGSATPTTTATPAEPETPSDTTSPVISDIQVTNITYNSATISWITDESADSKIHLSNISPIVATSTAIGIDSNYITNHSINLSNLDSLKTYYYIVVSEDNSGNTATSSEQLFITVQTPAPLGVCLISEVLTGYTNPLWDDVMDGADKITIDRSNHQLLRTKPDGSIETITTELVGTPLHVIVDGDYYYVGSIATVPPNTNFEGVIYKISRDGIVSFFAQTRSVAIGGMAKIGNYLYTVNDYSFAKIPSDGVASGCLVWDPVLGRQQTAQFGRMINDNGILVIYSNTDGLFYTLTPQ